MLSVERLTHNARVVAHALYLASVGTLLAPVSRRWRSRLTRARVASTHPFMERETDLSDFLDRSLDRVVVGPVASAHANVSELELLAMERNLADGGHVYTLNLPPDWEDQHPDRASDDTALAKRVKRGERFAGTPEASRITRLWGDSKSFDYTPYRGRMDLVFIDGAHSAEYPEADTKTALTLIRPEAGLIVWHDATRYGVAEFLREYLSGNAAPLRVVGDTSVGLLARVGRDFVDRVTWCRSRSGRPSTSPAAG
ncbi:MAG TPA: class I SAM-dependent methyltransferase [Gemmatimonadaceae bacterium]|nr:class I SAM-dependent methyltransferase [Gemmatimonadaceae bacterium]